MEEERRKEERKKKEENRHTAKFMQITWYNHNQADKGVVATIVDVDNDVQEANKQLNNKDFYKKNNNRHNWVKSNEGE